jgi:hypothetical protein
MPGVAQQVGLNNEQNRRTEDNIKGGIYTGNSNYLFEVPPKRKKTR